MTAHIHQLDRCGCTVACMAMVRGVPYETVRADVGEVGRGHDFMTWQDYLARHGFAAQMVWHTDQISQAKRDPWPLQPWADVHLCCVDAGHGSASHLVVMIADGTVLDPASDALRRLSDYPSVAYMAGVFHVAKQPLTSAPLGALGTDARSAETGTGSVEDEGPATSVATPDPSPLPDPITKAQAVLDGLDPAMTPEEHVSDLWQKAGRWNEPHQDKLIARADAIESALSTLRSHQENTGEGR